MTCLSAVFLLPSKRPLSNKTWQEKRNISNLVSFANNFRAAKCFSLLFTSQTGLSCLLVCLNLCIIVMFFVYIVIAC